MLPEEKGLVHCEWISALEEFSFYLRRDGIDHVMMHGGMTKKEQEASLSAFKSEAPGTPRLILLTNVALQGRNGLQRGNWVWQLGHNYTPGTDAQLHGRINRIGQKRMVLHAIKVILAGTYEMRVSRVNYTKERNQARLMALANETD